MLGILEDELIARLKASPLGSRLKAVDSLPDLPSADVIARWGLDAPAAYVVARDGTLDGDSLDVQFAIVLVARNARGVRAARQESAQVIGLYDMLGAATALLNNASTASASWRATAYQLLQDVALREQGLQAAQLTLATRVDAPQPDAQALNLGDFLAFHTDYDLAPHTPGEHPRWLDENHAAPAPDMQTHINPQEGT